MLADAANPRSLSHLFRSRRDKRLREFLIAQRGNKIGPFNVVDLGGGSAYWERVGLEWLALHEVHVLCVNHASGELTRDSTNLGAVSVEVGDACDLSAYPDNAFDLVHSNSVIEHVGWWPQMIAFAREVRRLAPAYYVQTPYFWFPIDPHFYRIPFFHWMPTSWRLKLHSRFRVGWAEAQPDPMLAMGLAESNVMLDRLQFGTLFPDALLSFERFFGIPKSMIAMRCAN